jgi:hypothetical protein
VLFLFNISAFYYIINMKELDMCKTYETFTLMDISEIAIDGQIFSYASSLPTCIELSRLYMSCYDLLL